MTLVTGMARKVVGRQPDRISKSVKPKARGKTATETVSQSIVLIVDDDPSVLRSLNRLVSASGFLVRTFGKPSELLASVIPGSNACLVVDINLPEMTGIEMCDALRASGRGLPAILITGRTDTRTRSLAEQSDAVAVLFKPFDEAPLLEAIGRALALSSTGGSEV